MAGWKQKRRHMRHYTRTAHVYNIRYADEQSLKIDVALENLKPRKGAILDLGCGTGLLLPRIQKTAKDIVGVDVSGGMLKEIPPSAKRSENVHLILADADQTPLRHGYFDAVLAITLLQNMSNPRNTLEEMKRVAKPDSSIIVTGLKKQFTQQSFLKLLEDAELKPRLLKTDERVKCHVTICEKR